MDGVKPFAQFSSSSPAPCIYGKLFLIRNVSSPIVLDAEIQIIGIKGNELKSKMNVSNFDCGDIHKARNGFDNFETINKLKIE